MLFFILLFLASNVKSEEVSFYSIDEPISFSTYGWIGASIGRFPGVTFGLKNGINGWGGVIFYDQSIKFYGLGFEGFIAVKIPFIDLVSLSGIGIYSYSEKGDYFVEGKKEEPKLEVVPLFAIHFPIKKRFVFGVEYSNFKGIGFHAGTFF